MTAGEQIVADMMSGDVCFGNLTRRELESRIDGAIADAVAAERRACALVAARRWVVDRDSTAYAIADAIEKRGKP